MPFTFADLESQKKAGAALRQGERQFEKAFRASPATTVVFKMDGFTFVAINDAFTKEGTTLRQSLPTELTA